MTGRREFLQIAAALAAAPPAAAVPAPVSGFAGRLSRLIFLDDVVALAARSPAIAKPAAGALTSNRDLFLGAGYLDAPAAKPGSPGDPAELALAAGRAVLPAASAIDAGDQRRRLERDARLLRELHARAGGSLAPAPARDAADLLEALSRRVLIGIHTYIPDAQDVEGWMERLIRLHDSAHAFWRQLAAAFQTARAAADEFYSASDPIIAAAVAVDGGALDPAEAGRALAAAPRTSYGRALADAHARLLKI